MEASKELTARISLFEIRPCDRLRRSGVRLRRNQVCVAVWRIFRWWLKCCARTRAKVVDLIDLVKRVPMTISWVISIPIQQRSSASNREDPLGLLSHLPCLSAEGPASSASADADPSNLFNTSVLARSALEAACTSPVKASFRHLITLT